MMNSMCSHHPRRHKITHPRSHSGNLHKTLVSDSHVFCHHVGTKWEKERERMGWFDGWTAASVGDYELCFSSDSFYSSRHSDWKCFSIGYCTNKPQHNEDKNAHRQTLQSPSQHIERKKGLYKMIHGKHSVHTLRQEHSLIFFVLLLCPQKCLPALNRYKLVNLLTLVTLWITHRGNHTTRPALLQTRMITSRKTPFFKWAGG